MKRISSLKVLSVLLLALLLGSPVVILAQETDTSNRVKPPKKETFEDRDDILAPARENCRHLGAVLVENCRPSHYTVYDAAHRLTLYNEDGEERFRFSLKHNEPDYFMDMKELVPLGTSPKGVENFVLLRLVGESDHWYKVEINEKTRETMFALKTDPLWSKTTWYTWLNLSVNLYPDYAKNKLRDKPGGEVIKDYAEMKFITYRFLEQDGDWVRVDCMDEDYLHYKGWIKWREGRDIIVEWYGNSSLRYPM